MLIIICTACEQVTLDSREVKVLGEESQGCSVAAKCKAGLSETKDGLS